MPRLTKWAEGHGWIENHDNDTRDWKNGNRACIDKLAAYEDAEEQGRVISIYNAETIKNALVQLNELELEMDDGRLVRLPCKVGDTVFWVSRFGSRVCTGVVRAIRMDAIGLELGISESKENHLTLWREYEKVFATHAEAEAALAAQGGEVGHG